MNAKPFTKEAMESAREAPYAGWRPRTPPIYPPTHQPIPTHAPHPIPTHAPTHTHPRTPPIYPPTPHAARHALGVESLQLQLGCGGAWSEDDSAGCLTTGRTFRIDRKYCGGQMLSDHLNVTDHGHGCESNKWLLEHLSTERDTDG